MIKLLSRLLSASRKNKRLISISYDSIAIVLSIYLATALRLDDFTFEIGLDETASALCTVIVTIFCFIRLGMYRAVLRYMMLPALGNIFIAVVISSVTLALSSFFFQSFVPRSVPFIYCGFAILAMGTQEYFSEPSTTIITEEKSQTYLSTERGLLVETLLTP